MNPSGYDVKLQAVQVGEHQYTIRSLRDRQQYSDPLGLAHARGISSASWSLFGQVWSSGLVLAEHMDGVVLDGQRVLEVGCGLAVPGIVLHRRLADVVVSDRHPECAAFLHENLRLNGLGPLPFRDVDWSGRNPALGSFDLIIGSDVLYERDHPRQLVEFFDRHARPRVEVLMVDPRRRQGGELARRMLAHGFRSTALLGPAVAGHRITHYLRE
jgi:predicted nicotinamide N-methyase